MALSARLQARQTQSLVITPQLMQAIRLLQMSSLELERFVAAELEQNPLLEEDEEGGAAAPTPTDGGEATADTEIAADNTALEAIDAERSDLFPNDSGYDASPAHSPGNTAVAPSAPAEFGVEQTLAARPSLDELLERKIDAVFTDPAERAIALALTAGLDEAGYLTIEIEAVARSLDVAPERVELVLGTCQDIAPTGVFARSLAECLELQLAERGRLDQPMQTLLANLEALAAGRSAELAALCGAGHAGLKRLVAELRSLDPKPGLAFVHEPTRTLVPDVFVRPGPDSDWIVELNDAVLPRLIVNNSYYAHVSSRSAPQERAFLDECRDKAKWLTKSLDQRARTMLRVATQIVRRQEGFLTDGVTHLKPLNLRMIADTLGIHESTVSRASANKTIATPRGIYEFRYFFTGAIPASAGGEAHSSEAVKHRIRKTIMEESPDAVLSDDAIVALLSREGVEIARRTVAKYREAMRIGSSVERRRDKRLKAAS